MRERRGARVILVDGEERFLLLHFKYERGALAGTDYWGLPGGGIDPGETPAAAAMRELAEETGVIVAGVGELAAESRYEFQLSSGEEVLEHDHFFVARRDGETELSGAGRTPEEAESLDAARWWRVDELRRAGVRTSPGDLADIVGACLAK